MLRTVARDYFAELRVPALRLLLETENAETTGAGFFTCFGFLGSRPLRF
jgi:hypothetical protein